MTTLQEEIAEGLDALLEFVETTATFGTEEVPCVDTEQDIVAELIDGGLEHDVDGAIIVAKAHFPDGIPAVGDKFTKGVHLCRIESVETEDGDPTMTLAFSLIESDPAAAHLTDPSFPCLVLDGGDADHDCD